MQITSRFTIAIHVLIAIEVFKGKYKVTSELLASSVHTNPVVIRRILQQLKAAGLIDVIRGTGGSKLKRDPAQISLLDIYHAVDCVGNKSLFHFHEDPNIQCQVGRNIHTVLDDKLIQMQEVFENEMINIKFSEILEETKQLIIKQQNQ